MRGQKGFVTTEFLFAIVIAFGMCALTFALTFTLSTVEIAQYIVYSSARAQAAGNLNKDAQANEAKTKYESLIKNKKLASLFANGWFSLTPKKDLDVRSGDGKNFESDYSAGGGVTSQGVRSEFTAKILEMRLPFLGKVTPEDDQGFKTRIAALLIREPSHEECVNFTKNRIEQFSSNGNFDGRFGKFLTSPSALPIPWEDNGC